jgi:hypothetical protein
MAAISYLLQLYLKVFDLHVQLIDGVLLDQLIYHPSSRNITRLGDLFPIDFGKFKIHTFFG